MCCEQRFGSCVNFIGLPNENNRYGKYSEEHDSSVEVSVTDVSNLASEASKATENVNNIDKETYKLPSTYAYQRGNEEVSTHSTNTNTPLSTLNTDITYSNVQIINVG